MRPSLPTPRGGARRYSSALRVEDDGASSPRPGCVGLTGVVEGRVVCGLLGDGGASSSACRLGSAPRCHTSARLVARPSTSACADAGRDIAEQGLNDSSDSAGTRVPLIVHRAEGPAATAEGTTFNQGRNYGLTIRVSTTRQVCPLVCALNVRLIQLHSSQYLAPCRTQTHNYCYNYTKRFIRSLHAVVSRVAV